MNVSVYSREAIERIISDGKFPDNTAVISFYDPAIKHIDKDYTHVDYSEVCKDVFYSELEDLDLEVLKRKGYTYDIYFPEVDDMAKFIIKAYENGKDIICQCEYGQSRSAGCAAAILEFFCHNGISIFSDYKYYPNQVVYHKIFDALEKQMMYAKNRYYYAMDNIHKYISEINLPDKIVSGYQPENGNSVVDAKQNIEKYLSEQNRLFHSTESIINALLKDGQPIYASFTVTDIRFLHDIYLWNPYAVCTCFKYGCEKIPVIIWFRKFRSAFGRRTKKDAERKYYFPSKKFESFDFFGRLTWDSKRKMIDAVPIIITNIQI